MSVNKCRVHCLSENEEFGHPLVFSKSLKENGEVVGAVLRCPDCGLSRKVFPASSKTLILPERNIKFHQSTCRLVKSSEFEGMPKMTHIAFSKLVEEGKITTYCREEAEGKGKDERYEARKHVFLERSNGKVEGKLQSLLAPEVRSKSSKRLAIGPNLPSRTKLWDSVTALKSLKRDSFQNFGKRMSSTN